MFAGLDIGSTSTKAVLMNDKRILASHILLSGRDFHESSVLVMEKVLKELNMKLEDISLTITTGYGRFIAALTEAPSEEVTEITCCARGAYFLCPTSRTIIDIGGQDVKAIKINETGRVTDFALNDKCAAGTGRFLERIAGSLGLTMDEMTDLSLKSNIKLPLSNTCTVFAETEVVSRISKGEPIEGIARGIHNALGGRICALAERLGIQEDIFICGGGAKNAGLVREIQDTIGRLTLPPQEIDPRLVPAIGAALIAKERYSSRTRTEIGGRA